MQTILRQQDYGARLESEGKVVARYHLVGSHGGAWMFRRSSGRELRNYEVLPRRGHFNVPFAMPTGSQGSPTHSPSGICARGPSA
jgi:hypothetical protein